MFDNIFEYFSLSFLITKIPTNKQQTFVFRRTFIPNTTFVVLLVLLLYTKVLYFQAKHMEVVTYG